MSSNLEKLGISHLADFGEEAPEKRDRQGKAQPMIGFCFKHGAIRAFAYAHLYSYEYNGSDQITLYFTGHTVILDGVNLAKLADSIQRHVETLIPEQDEFHGDAKGEKSLVSRIVVTQNPA